MNLDERLEKIGLDLESLKERHEALTGRHEALTERHEALTQSVELHNHNFSQIGRNFELALDSIKRLENIAGSHEQRIEDLEDKQ
jgi:predicted nuclease with TOPRIM domain